MPGIEFFDFRVVLLDTRCNWPLTYDVTMCASGDMAILRAKRIACIDAGLNLAAVEMFTVVSCDQLSLGDIAVGGG